MIDKPAPASPAPQPERFLADFSEGLETGLYLALLELIDEALIITGDETIIEVNSAAVKLLERDYRQLVGQALASIFPSERAFLEARARLLIQEQMRGSIDISLPGGRKRSMRFIAAARIRPGIHALILSPDLIAEAYTPPSTTDPVWPRLAAATEQPVIVLDADGRIRAVNSNAQAWLEHGREQLVGQPHESVFEIIPSSGGSADQITLRVPATNKAWTGRQLDGPRSGWHLLVLNPTRPTTQNDDQQVTDSLKTAQHVFSESPLPTLICSPDGSIRWSNPAVSLELGYSALRLLRFKLSDLRADGRPALAAGKWRLRRRNRSEFDAQVISWSAGQNSGFTIYCVLSTH